MKYVVVFFIFFTLNLNALTLQQAIDLALKNNPYLNKKTLDVDIQKRETAKLKATHFGSIDAITSLNKYDSPRVLQPITFKYKAKDILSIGVEYKVPLFTGFEITEKVKISKLQEKLKSLSVKLTKNQIIFNIKSIYYKILSLKYQLKAMEKYKVSLEKLLSDVSLMVKTGKKAEVDLYKVQYDIKNVDAIIEEINNNIDTLKYSLKELIGKEDLRITTIEDVNLNNNFKPKKVNFEKITSIKEVDLKKKISKENVRKVRSLYFPKIYLNSNIFENYGNGNDINTWQITLNLQFNLFDFGKKRNEVAQAELERKKIDYEKIQIKLKKEREIRDAINKIKSIESQIKAYKKQIKFAKESERIEKLKYEQGVSQIYDYLYAKSRRFIAESKYYSALYSHEEAIAYYDYVIEKWAQ